MSKFPTTLLAGLMAFTVCGALPVNPWNPDRNVNYTRENTRLPVRPGNTVYHEKTC